MQKKNQTIWKKKNRIASNFYIVLQRNKHFFLIFCVLLLFAQYIHFYSLPVKENAFIVLKNSF